MTELERIEALEKRIQSHPNVRVRIHKALEAWDKLERHIPKETVIYKCDQCGAVVDDYRRRRGARVFCHRDCKDTFYRKLKWMRRVQGGALTRRRKS